MYCVAGCYDGYLYFISISTGSIRWKFLTGDVLKSTPLIVGNTVYAGSYDKYLYKLNVVSNGALEEH